MKYYYIEYSNGDCDFIYSYTDHTAYNRACKMARELHTNVRELHEISENEEVEEALRIIISDGKEQ